MIEFAREQELRWWIGREEQIDAHHIRVTFMFSDATQATTVLHSRINTPEIQAQIAQTLVEGRTPFANGA